MDRRCSIDGQTKFATGDPSLGAERILMEWKSAPQGGFTPPIWFRWPQRGLVRRAYLVPACLLLVVGLAVPGFLVTLTLLIVCTAVALGAFVLCVQLPLGYVLRCWHGLRHRYAATAAEPRRAPSSGI